jgi:diguanylate cyclase (GGDEF)-like protein/PAS domain S-box-containing protein
VSALLFGYGVLGMPDLAVKSPIWTAYLIILAARPFTGSPKAAAFASITVVLQYWTIALFFIGSYRLALLDSPLDSVRATGTSPFDEATKILLLTLGGVVLTCATAWNQRTLRRSVAKLRESEAWLEAVFKHSAVGIVRLDEFSGIMNGNKAFERVLGCPMSELRGRLLADFSPAEEAAVTATLVRDVAAGSRANASAEVRFVRADGHIKWASLTVSRAEGDLGLIGMVQDVSERKELETELLHQAFHDPLTELANRSLFTDRVNHAVARSAREAERVAVLFLDLDNFKAVNDTQGHAAGDRLLRGIAATLLSATRGCDTVARLGGDEFAVLLESVNVSEGAEIAAQRVVEALRRVETAPGCAVGVSASIGIAVHGGLETTDDLLRNADLAMYEAKNRTRGRWVIYNSDMHAAFVDRVSLETDLRRAFERCQLVDLPRLAETGAFPPFEGVLDTETQITVAYQPIVDVRSQNLTGIEALLRWAHPGRGDIPPAVFIPIAEESGLIVSLGRWVLREACRRAAGWNARRTGPPITITVNLSGKQIEDERLASDVEAVLQETGLAPECLVLEITETVIMQESVTTRTRLNELKGLGVSLAIDDFGTGYSSLSHLQQFPVDILKIDRSFIERMHAGSNDTALVRTIIALGKLLSLRTIAEGVESVPQHEQLRELGCDSAQGYLFGRPMDDRAIDDLLTSIPVAATTRSRAPRRKRAGRAR